MAGDLPVSNIDARIREHWNPQTTPRVDPNSMVEPSTMQKKLHILNWGRREAGLTITFGRRSVWVETGCFAGTLADLRSEVETTHSEIESVNRREYEALIAFVSSLAKVYGDQRARYIAETRPQE